MLKSIGFVKLFAISKTTMPKKNELTPQAKLAALGYILVTISMIIIAILTADSKTLKYFLIRITTYIVIAVISVYAINCTVVGSCHMYAWVIGYISVVMGTIVMVSLILGLGKF